MIQKIAFHLILICLLTGEYCLGKEKPMDLTFTFQDSLCNWELMWKRDFKTIDNRELLVLDFYCRSEYDDLNSIINIYSFNPDKYVYNKYKLLFKQQTTMGNSVFLDIRFFSYSPVGDTAKRQFFLLQELQEGSGQYKLEWIYHINKDGIITEVSRGKNPELKGPTLDPDLGFKRQGSMYVSDDTIYAEEALYKKKGSGEYFASLKTHYKIVMDTINIEKYYLLPIQIELVHH